MESMGGRFGNDCLSLWSLFSNLKLRIASCSAADHMIRRAFFDLLIIRRDQTAAIVLGSAARMGTMFSLAAPVSIYIVTDE